MPYLNWKETQFRQEVSSHPTLETQLHLGLDSGQIGALLPLLEEIYFSAGSELRLDLPKDWVLFWRLREGGSRFLLAHPERERWVGTVALEMDRGRELVLSLKNLQEGKSLTLSQLGPLDGINNFELVISFEK